MKDTVVIRLVDKKELRHKPFECSDYENHSVITVKNQKRAMKKLSIILQDKNVIIPHNYEGEYIFQNHLQIYNRLSYKTVLPTIEKICRAVASKFKLRIPFEDIYIYAKPSTACEFIGKLIGISRMFTVVTSCENAGREADELYFKHGCLIRHIQKPEGRISADSIAIYIEETSPLQSVPSINITSTFLQGEKVLDVRKIMVSDDRISALTNQMGATSGLLIYDLIKELPCENAHVNINKDADRFFLLDTKGF